MKKKFMYICLTTGLFSSGILVNNLNAYRGYVDAKHYYLSEKDCEKVATKAFDAENQIRRFFNDVIFPILMIKTDDGLVFDRLLNATIDQVPIRKINTWSLQTPNADECDEYQAMRYTSGRTIKFELGSMVIVLTGYNTEKGEVKVSVSMNGDAPCFARKVKRNGKTIDICNEDCEH